MYKLLKFNSQMFTGFVLGRNKPYDCANIMKTEHFKALEIA